VKRRGQVGSPTHALRLGTKTCPGQQQCPRASPESVIPGRHSHDESRTVRSAGHAGSPTHWFRESDQTWLGQQQWFSVSAFWI
jgi:hypothetical protein